MEFKIFLIRIILTFILALIFGIERQRSHKPVGFGTFIFVAIGACGLSLIALEIGKENPLPLLSAIVTGIGFLGAGALIKTTDKIFGFTTAASIWLFAIMGLIMGTGYYYQGLVIYGLIWISLFIDREIEKGNLTSYQKKVSIKIIGLDNEEILNNLLIKNKIKKFKILNKKVNKKEKFISLTYLIDGFGKNVRSFLKDLEKEKSFEEYSFE